MNSRRLQTTRIRQRHALPEPTARLIANLAYGGGRS